MAPRVMRANPIAAPEVSLRLHEPGMTQFLRAGLGGVAASIHAIGRESGGWPDQVRIEDGWATVRPTDLILHWGDSGPQAFIKQLIVSSFQLDNYGQVYLPGAYGDALKNRPEVVAALHLALRRSFLGHPKFVSQPTRHTHMFEVDDEQYAFETERLAGYIHQKQATALAKAFETHSHLGLASWVYPGAAQRHIAFSDTKVFYPAAQALCALFAMVGCISYRAPRASVVVVPDPAELVAFGQIRTGLTSQSYQTVHVAGPGDAVLAMNSALRLDDVGQHGHAVAAASAVLIGRVAWDRQRRVRVATIDATTFDDRTLDLYHEIRATLPPVLRRRKPAASSRPGARRSAKRTRSGGVDGSAFVTISALRGFVTENVAHGRLWHQDFATATDGGDPPRWIHYYRNDERRNLGALHWEDREGLKTMSEHLDDAERVLVESVHEALRRRFGQIAEESKSNPVAMRNRWDGERERWRLAFAGAKTQEQVRAALADLWSRGGGNTPLRKHWATVLPLLRTERWRTARDLALVALASYSGRDREDSDGKDEVVEEEP